MHHYQFSVECALYLAKKKPFKPKIQAFACHQIFQTLNVVDCVWVLQRVCHLVKRSTHYLLNCHVVRMVDQAVLQLETIGAIFSNQQAWAWDLRFYRFSVQNSSHLQHWKPFDTWDVLSQNWFFMVFLCNQLASCFLLHCLNFAKRLYKNAFILFY